MSCLSETQDFSLTPSNKEDGDVLKKLIENEKKSEVYIPCRFLLVLFGFFGLLLVYFMRVNMSIALIAMVNNTAIRESENVSEDCHAPYSNDTPDNQEDGPHIWSRYQQGVILSSFFYGYIITQVPGGWLSDSFGGKKVYGFGILITSIATLLTPLAAYHGFATLVVIRTLTGLSEGVTFPAIISLWSKWAPVYERGRLVNLSFLGATTGILTGLSISGVLSHSNFLGGWPSVFYVSGTLGCLFCIVWMIFIFDTPSLHPRISKQERKYIENSLGTTHNLEKVLRVPIISIVTSLPVWAIAVGNFCSAWGIYILLTSLPQYLKTILRFRIKFNGILSMSPYFGSYVVTLLAGYLSDILITKRNIRIVTVRKICGFIAFFPPGVCLVLVNIAGCNYIMVMSLLCVGIALSSFTAGSTLINQMDLAPRFSGIIFGMTSMISSTAGLLSPIVVGYVTSKKSTMVEWKTLFFLTSGLYFMGGIFYLIFGSGSLQSWADGYKMEDHIDEETRQKSNEVKTMSINCIEDSLPKAIVI